MAKKRTKAQRAAAAKAAWAERRAREATAKQPAVAASSEVKAVAQHIAASPKIAYAVREGDNVFVCFGQDGSLNRERLDESTARKLLRELTAILV